MKWNEMTESMFMGMTANSYTFLYAYRERTNMFGKGPPPLQEIKGVYLYMLFPYITWYPHVGENDGIKINDLGVILLGKEFYTQ